MLTARGSELAQNSACGVVRSLMGGFRTGAAEQIVSMLATRRRVLAVLVAVVALGATVTAGAATKPPTVPKLKTRIAKLKVDVAGYVETRLLHDTTSDCFPGERWIQTNRFIFETGKFVNLSVTNIAGQGFRTTTTRSSFSRSAGRTTVEGEISDYKTTNYCKGEQQKLDGAPSCAAKNIGKLAVALTPGEAPSENDELTPLSGRPLLLSLKRVGGGRDAVRCFGRGAGQVTGKDTDAAIVTTSFVPGLSVIVPANLDAIKVFDLRAKARLRRAVVIDGPCTNVEVTVVAPPGRSPNPGALNADSDCRLFGKIVVTVRPRTK